MSPTGDLLVTSQEKAKDALTREQKAKARKRTKIKTKENWLVVWNIFYFSIIYGIILPID
jgi:hypothetical protein